MKTITELNAIGEMLRRAEAREHKAWLYRHLPTEVGRFIGLMLALVFYAVLAATGFVLLIALEVVLSA